MSSPRHLLPALLRLVGLLSLSALTGLVTVAEAHAVVGGPSADRPAPSQGYWLVTADGTAYAFGDARLFGSNRNRGTDIVGMARTPDGQGYWMVDEDGDVFHYGKALSLGSRVHNADDVVGFTASPEGNGYWIAASDGGIFAFGEAGFHGSTGAIRLNQPIVEIASTPSGKGYWLVATDGGIFAFGDAAFYGSTGAIRLNRPIVGMAASPSGEGYWLVASDGGIFSFGDAHFHGSAGSIDLSAPVISIVATPSDQRPLASDDSITTEEDSALEVAVLDNDPGLGDDPVTVAIVTGPAHGTASGDGEGRIRYIPAADFAGTDSLVYRVIDADGDEATATVHITVSGRNDAPVAGGVSLSTDEDVPATGTVAGTDLDGDALSFRLASPAGHGSVTVDGSGGFVYTPDRGYAGPDGFVVGVDDGHGGTAESVVSVTVAVIDDHPGAVSDAATGTEDSPLVIDVAANDTGLSDGGVVVSVDAGTLDPSTEGTVTVAGGTVTLVPAPNVHGAVTFDYTISDADGDSATATVTVTLMPVGDAPTVPVLEDVTVPAGTRDSGPIAFAVGDVDTPVGSLNVTATSSNPTLVPDGGLQLSQGSPGIWALVVTPVHRQEGTSTITITVSDGTASAVATFNFTVLPR